MRSASWLLLSAFFVILSGCGGSSSETPWPQEPENTAIGPAGETSPSGVSDERESPDAGPAEPKKVKRPSAK